jgi:hypothetical protein
MNPCHAFCALSRHCGLRVLRVAGHGAVQGQIPFQVLYVMPEAPTSGSNSSSFMTASRMSLFIWAASRGPFRCHGQVPYAAIACNVCVSSAAEIYPRGQASSPEA